MSKRTESAEKALPKLDIPSEEVLQSNPGLRKALKVKKDSESKRCKGSNPADPFAYSGHNDYSSIKR